MSLGGAVLHHGCLVKEAAGLCQPPAPCPCPSFRFRAFIRPKEGIPLAWDIQGTRKAPFENEGGFLAFVPTAQGYAAVPIPLGHLPCFLLCLGSAQQQKAPPKRCLPVFVYLMPLCRSFRYFVWPKNPSPLE